MPLPCYCVDIRRFDFRGDYITDKQLKQTIDSLVSDTLIIAAAEDVTERVVHEALLKTAKGGSHNKRFIMTSKKLPATKSDDEIHTDNEALVVPQGDTPFAPEGLKTVHTLGEENVCTEKESLEEEIKKMISKISSFNFEHSSGKVNATEGQGDAEVVESTPTARETICESQGAPNLLLQRSSSEERKFQEITAAWEEAVEVEVQVMDPDYEDENNLVNHRESTSPYISRKGSISKMGPSIYWSTGEVAPTALKHPDQTELEALAIGTDMVIEIMSRVDDAISASEPNLHHMEGSTEHPYDIQDKENDNNDKMNKNISANKQDTIELEKDQTIAPVVETTIPSLTEPESGKETKEESDEEDLYDIESITVCSNEFLMPNAHHTSANSNLHTNSHTVPSSGFQKNGKDLELKSYEKIGKIDINESMFKHAAEVTVPFPSVQSPHILTGQIMGASAKHLFNSRDTKAIKPMEDKEYFEIGNIIVTKGKEAHVENPNCLAARNEYVTPEHFKSFTSPTIPYKKMGNKVQSYDDIFVKPAEQSHDTSLHDNEFGRTEMPPTSCVRSLDSLSEVNYKCSRSEETIYLPGQKEKLHNAININTKVSQTLRCNDSQSSLATNSEITEHKPPASSSGVLNCSNELLDMLDVQKAQPCHSQALALPNTSTFDTKDTTDVNAPISTEEVLCTRTQSSQNLMEATFCNTQEGKNREQSYADFLEAAFTSSYENKSVQDIMCNSSNIKQLPQIISKPERIVKIENRNIPSSSQDEKGARKKNDIDSNLSRKKFGPGEAPNGKVCKTWKFTNKMKKLISSIKRKN